MSPRGGWIGNLKNFIENNQTGQFSESPELLRDCPEVLRPGSSSEMPETSASQKFHVFARNFRANCNFELQPCKVNWIRVRAQLHKVYTTLWNLWMQGIKLETCRKVNQPQTLGLETCKWQITRIWNQAQETQRFSLGVQLHKEAYVSVEVAHKEPGLFQPFSSLKQSQRSNLSLYDLGETYKWSQGSPYDLGAQGRHLAI